MQRDRQSPVPPLRTSFSGPMFGAYGLPRSVSRHDELTPVRPLPERPGAMEFSICCGRPDGRTWRTWSERMRRPTTMPSAIKRPIDSAIEHEEPAVQGRVITNVTDSTLQALRR